MAPILGFESEHGKILLEVEQDTAVANQHDTNSSNHRLVSKGILPKTGIAELGEPIPAGSFDGAMSTLRAYAASMQDIISSLELAPTEVSVEIGLKMSGSAGFIIAKADAASEMKVSLKWEPISRPQA
jgi:hypothetical protein